MNLHLIPQVIRHELVAPHEVHLGAMASGGLSGAWIWQGQSPHGPVALRAWPTVHPTPERLSQIHAAMRTARQLGLEIIPRIFGNRQGDSYVSDGQRLWELTQWMPGAADYHSAPSAQRLQAAMRSLAELHLAWYRAAAGDASTAWSNCSAAVASVVGPVSGASPTVAERRQKLEFSLQQQSAWQRCVFASGADCAARQTDSLVNVFGPNFSEPTAAALSSLAQQTLLHLAALGPGLLRHLIEVQATPVRLQFVLRDVWSDHILFSEDRVSGIIDFGAARVDEPATDVARLLGSLEPLDASRWLLGWQAYHAGNPHIELVRVQLLDRVGTLLAAVQWLQWLVIQPRQFDAPLPQLLERWRRLVVRLENGNFGCFTH